MRRHSTILILLAIWLVLSGTGVVVHSMIWSDVSGPDPAHVQFDGPLIKPLANFMQVLVMPGWIMLRMLPGTMMRAHLGLIFFAYGASWAAWMLAGIGLWKLRSLALRYPGAGEQNSSGSQPRSLARRRFLVDGTMAGAAVMTGGSAVKASLVDPWQLHVRRYEVPIRGLPASLDGLRIVQVSDTHFGPRVPSSFIAHVVDRAVALRPDLFALTGDYVHFSHALSSEAAEILAPLGQRDSSRFGAVGVLGNHDHYAGAAAVRHGMESAGVVMIDNARVFLDMQRDSVSAEMPEGETLCVAGLGDLLTSQVLVDRALGGVSEDVARVVLAHVPDTAELERIKHGPRIDVMLSGHTHGGQVRLPIVGTPIVPSEYGQKYAGGLVRGPACPVVVSRGIGMSVLPVRFGVPPELVEITLVSM